MTARGRAVCGGKEYIFGDGAFGLLDWGRGVWPFHNEWYWSNGTGTVDGKIFGFNLGTGFGNTSQATENMLFYNGKYHKLGRVHFDLDTEYMKPWRLYDDEGRLDLTLTPCYDRTTRMKVLFVDNCCHQMFGGFSGRAVLDDGTVLQIDDLQAFCRTRSEQLVGSPAQIKPTGAPLPFSGSGAPLFSAKQGGICRSASRPVFFAFARTYSAPRLQTLLPLP